MATEEMRALPKSTSREPEFPQDQQRLFRDVLELFNLHRLPYVVSGAFALHWHTGIWRNTKDLDLFMPAEHVPEALHILKEAGFETEVADDVWIAKAHWNGYNVDLITGMSNGAITVETHWIERAAACSVLGVPSRVLGPEELIASKIFVAARDRFDGSDVVHLIYRTCGNLDWDYLLELVSQRGDHWGVLFWHLVLFAYVYPAETYLVPRGVWDDLMERFREKIRHPDPDSRFRGSLIDENMFHIDLKEWGLPSIIDELRDSREPKIPPGAANPNGRRP